MADIKKPAAKPTTAVVYKSKPAKVLTAEDAYLKYAELYGKYGLSKYFDPLRLMAQMMIESGGDPEAESNRGAFGLTQIMPATQRELKVTREQLKDPAVAIATQARYMDMLPAQYSYWRKIANGGTNAPSKGTVMDIERSYNGGAKGYNMNQLVRDSEENRDYSVKINKRYKTLKDLEAKYGLVGKAIANNAALTQEQRNKYLGRLGSMGSEAQIIEAGQSVSSKSGLADVREAMALKALDHSYTSFGNKRANVPEATANEIRSRALSSVNGYYNRGDAGALGRKGDPNSTDLRTPATIHKLLAGDWEEYGMPYYTMPTDIYSPSSPYAQAREQMVQQDRNEMIAGVRADFSPQTQMPVPDTNTGAQDYRELYNPYFEQFGSPEVIANPYKPK